MRRQGMSALRRATHRTVHEVTQAVETFRFNVAVARVMELVNAARKAIDSGRRRRPTPRCARPPRRSRSCSRSSRRTRPRRCGSSSATSRASPWSRGPRSTRQLLVVDSVTCVVQVAGKVRDRLEVSPDITEDELRELALASEAVQRALEGRGDPHRGRPRAASGQRRSRPERVAHPFVKRSHRPAWLQAPDADVDRQWRRPAVGGDLLAVVRADGRRRQEWGPAMRFVRRG